MGGNMTTVITPAVSMPTKGRQIGFTGDWDAAAQAIAEANSAVAEDETKSVMFVLSGH